MLAHFGTTTLRTGAQMDHRQATRYRVSAPAFFAWQRADGTLQEAQGTSRDISERGVFILAQELPVPGTHVELDVYLPTVTGGPRSTQLHGEGTVVRTSGQGARESGFAAAVVFRTESSGPPLVEPERIQ